MPTPEQQFRQMARELAEHAQAEEASLQREIFDLEAQLAEKRAARKTARLADKRLADYSVKSGGNYQCPTCWIKDEARATLRAVGGGTDTADFFRCDRCHSDFSITVGF